MVPVCPWPVLSVTVVPEPWSNPYDATSPFVLGAGAGTGVGDGVGVGVGDGAAVGAVVTAKDWRLESVSPSLSLTVRVTYLVSAFWKVLVILQPVAVSHTIEPSWFSKDQVQLTGALPCERVPSSVTGAPVWALVGAVHTALAATSPGVGLGVGVGLGGGVGVGVGAGAVVVVLMPRSVLSLASPLPGEP